jgi:periplasmic protein TonB
MNINWNNVTSDNRNAIVFEGRNQKYGAYKIRTTYNQTLTIVLASMIGFSASVYGFKSFFDRNAIVEEKPKKNYEVVEVDYTPPVDKDKDIPVTEPQAAPETHATTTAFVPPTIDDNADDNTHTQEDVVNTNIGSNDHIGDSSDVVPPITGTGSGSTSISAPEAPAIFTVVEEMPEFEGGLAAMAKFIQTNLQYPTVAREAGISGKCFLKFIVGGNGQIANVEVLKGVQGCPECDVEAIRVVKTMPNWKGGKQNGRPVNVYYNLPINFKVK